MIILFLIVLLVIIVGVVIEIFHNGRNEIHKYEYRQKNFFMSRAEHECYDALVIAVGNKYHIFPQVHLPAIVDSKMIGQNWRGAFHHINQKSLDFVLCDKEYIAPKLAIELDDSTHERPDRIKRDKEVERILNDAHLPLLRLQNHGSFNPDELNEKINIV